MVEKGVQLVNVTHMITLRKRVGGFQETGHEETEWQLLTVSTHYIPDTDTSFSLYTIPKHPQKLLDPGSRVFLKAMCYRLTGGRKCWVPPGVLLKGTVEVESFPLPLFFLSGPRSKEFRPLSALVTPAKL